MAAMTPPPTNKMAAMMPMPMGLLKVVDFDFRSRGGFFRFGGGRGVETAFSGEKAKSLAGLGEKTNSLPHLGQVIALSLGGSYWFSKTGWHLGH